MHVPHEGAPEALPSRHCVLVPVDAIWDITPEEVYRSPPSRDRLDRVSPWNAGELEVLMF